MLVEIVSSVAKRSLYLSENYTSLVEDWGRLWNFTIGAGFFITIEFWLSDFLGKFKRETLVDGFKYIDLVIYEM